MLFHLVKDPAERDNLVDSAPDILEQMQAKLARWCEANRSLSKEAGMLSHSFEESDKLRAHLEDLGYL